jgi:hypothetical protein
MNTVLADRKALLGDRISGVVITFTDGFTWSGEFNATYGDRKLTALLATCDQAKVGAVYLQVTSDPTPTTALTYPHITFLDEGR